jgi:hypothetical protein
MASLLPPLWSGGGRRGLFFVLLQNQFGKTRSYGTSEKFFSKYEEILRKGLRVRVILV